MVVICEMQMIELKRFLKIYADIKKDVGAHQQYAIIKRAGRNKKVEIPEWSYCLQEFIEFIVEQLDDQFVSQIIDLSYINGKKDKTVLSEVAISESSFYRFKKQFEERLYRLYIISGYVTRDELMRDKFI